MKLFLVKTSHKVPQNPILFMKKADMFWSGGHVLKRTWYLPYPTIFHCILQAIWNEINSRSQFHKTCIISLSFFSYFLYVCRETLETRTWNSDTRNSKYEIIFIFNDTQNHSFHTQNDTIRHFTGFWRLKIHFLRFWSPLA